MSNAANPNRKLWVLTWLVWILAVLLLAFIAVYVISNLNRPDPQSVRDPAARIPAPPASAADGAPGLNDPYFPSAGNGGYDVGSYTLDVSWEPPNLVGKSIMVATATADLRSFVVDFYLELTAVTVDGTPAQFRRSDQLNVQIQPTVALPKNAEFTVEFSYRGNPAQAGDGSAWNANRDEWVIAGEPGSAPYWFPANDHPTDPALFEVTMRVPRGLQAVSGGALVRSAEGSSTASESVWQWRMTQPAATYLFFLAVGRFQITTAEVGGVSGWFAVSEQLPDAETLLARLVDSTKQELKRLVGRLGTFPFSEIGGVIPAVRFRFGALETQTRPVYLASALRRNFDPLVNHELAHMWYGNRVRVKEWPSIFLNEAYASYSTWLMTGREQQIFGDSFERSNRDVEAWRIKPSDPSRTEMFSFAVYQRGPMALQALSNVLGETIFSRLSREWVAEPTERSLQEWRAFMAQGSGKDLTQFFAVWLDGTTVPQRSAENGFT